ncbi:MAG: hypothetical protein IOC82_06615 [Aestuariivirga sp.]|uniref:hypothetical protein n=1 Tax=Aestuariivirga sp. TaxID=2650926 RepID=UPI0025C3007A|nr:hypothetical protein [Aestuariivirga sp.]MCA3560689.1 hypothetical protein [Aestuariivirga sp.]
MTISELPPHVRKLHARMEAAERRKVRRTMDYLEEMAGFDWGYCIGMESLMQRFGNLIVQQVRHHLVTGNRDHRVLPPVLDTIARWAEWHSAEFGDPENQHVAEALDAVTQAAVNARRIVAEYEAAH